MGKCVISQLNVSLTFFGHYRYCRCFCHSWVLFGRMTNKNSYTGSFTIPGAYQIEFPIILFGIYLNLVKYHIKYFDIALILKLLTKLISDWLLDT